jgi:hypothetical protein
MYDREYTHIYVLYCMLVFMTSYSLVRGFTKDTRDLFRKLAATRTSLFPSSLCNIKFETFCDRVGYAVHGY